MGSSGHHHRKIPVDAPEISVREFLRADNGDLVLFIKEHDRILVKWSIAKIEECIRDSELF